MRVKKGLYGVQAFFRILVRIWNNDVDDETIIPFSHTLGDMLRHDKPFTDKSLCRAESLEVTSCSNSSSQLDTSRLSSLNGLELSVLKRYRSFQLFK